MLNTTDVIWAPELGRRDRRITQLSIAVSGDRENSAISMEVSVYAEVQKEEIRLIKNLK